MAPTRMADQVGRVLGGRYRLRAALGTGASAQVFLADDAALSRQVAVKLLHPALAGDSTFLRRFQADSRAGYTRDNKEAGGRSATKDANLQVLLRERRDSNPRPPA